jgi:hypothetical protein
MIDIIDYEQNQFENKAIKGMIPDENKRKEFLSLLGKKREIK